MTGIIRLKKGPTAWMRVQCWAILKLLIQCIVKVFSQYTQAWSLYEMCYISLGPHDIESNVASHVNISCFC